MTRYLLSMVAIAASVGLVFGTIGCESATTPTASESARKPHSHGDHNHGKTGEDQKEIEAALAKLPAKDRELAEKQKICPVTEEPLGSMGKPEKLTVEGKEVFICCAGCKDKILKEPAKYLAKIGK